MESVPGTGTGNGVWHAAKMKECDLFSHWQSFDFARARFSTADFTLWPKGGTLRGWEGGEVDCLAGWLLVALVAFIELAISLAFELLLSLVVAYLLAAFGRVLCFTSTRCCFPPPPHGFPFFIWQISAHAGPSLVSLKKDTIGAVAAACCLLSVFFFRSLVKWFPHIIAFVVRPTLAQWHAPSPCTPIRPSSSRAPNPGHVEIIRQDLCEWATVFAICLQRRRRHQTRTTRTARTARRWQ